MPIFDLWRAIRLKDGLRFKKSDGGKSPIGARKGLYPDKSPKRSLAGAPDQQRQENSAG
jgi:hypothetical protein